MADPSLRPLAAVEVLKAERAMAGDIIVSATSQDQAGYACWLGMLHAHVDALRERPIVLARGRTKLVPGRIVVLAPDSPLTPWLEVLLDPNAPEDQYSEMVDSALIVDAPACSRLHVEGSFVRHALGDIDGRPFALWLFAASSREALASRLLALGMMEEDLAW